MGKPSNRSRVAHLLNQLEHSERGTVRGKGTSVSDAAHMAYIENKLREMLSAKDVGKAMYDLTARRLDGDTLKGQADAISNMSKGGKNKSRVNEAGNYTKPAMRKRIFNRIKAGSKGGRPGQWSARKAQMLAKAYKAAGGGYRN